MKKWLLPFMVITLTLHGMVVCQRSNNLPEYDYNIQVLNDLIDNNPEGFCQYVKCQENINREDCPEGTIYTEGVAQFGCCGACVRFKQQGERECTGSVDPEYSEGYTVKDKKAIMKTITGGQSAKYKDQHNNNNNKNKNNVIIINNNSNLSNKNNNTLYSSWCDFTLKCNGSGICNFDPDKKSCKAMQKSYDEAVANPEEDPVTNYNSTDYVYFRDDYRWRPNCTSEGKFVEKQCKGPVSDDRCVCVDPNGSRIFGSALFFQTELYNSMNCKCSRRVWEKKKAGRSSVTIHCATNGNYEPLQCDDGWCYCMEPSTGMPEGPFLPDSAMNLLRCYNNVTLKGQQYLRRCESEFLAQAVLSDLLVAKSVKPPKSVLNCDEDGSYGPIQRNGVVTGCMNRYNTGQLLATPGAGRCECVRDMEMFKEEKIPQELQCDNGNGTYLEKQLRGNTVFCSDEDGVRMGPLVYPEYETYLDCQKALSCQQGTKEDCPLVCKDCPPEYYVNY